MDQERMVPSFRGDTPVAAHTAALSDRRELALVAFERTRMPIVITDAQQFDNPIVLANRAFLDLTGYSADEVIGRNCRFLQGPETAPEDVEAIRQALASGRDRFDVELLNYRKDGSRFWNQLVISPVYDEAGRAIYHFASQQDVTARRDAERLEASERLLLMEVDHRAMNALSLVQSIVRLSQAETAEGFAASVRGRVDALARAHRLLAHARWSGAELADIVASAAGAQAVRMHGPATAVPASTVQPLALALYELAANARQHGALANGSEAVSLTWELSPDELVLHWSETGQVRSGQVPPPGLGLKLVKALIEKQLAGRLAMNWLDRGLEVDIALPRAGGMRRM